MLITVCRAVVEPMFQQKSVHCCELHFVPKQKTKMLLTGTKHVYTLCTIKPFCILICIMATLKSHCCNARLLV